MAKRIVIAGYAAVGRALLPLLVARGDAATVVQRRNPGQLPYQARFVAADLEDAGKTVQACHGADAVVCAAGVPYHAATYVRVWPVIMRNLLQACAKASARFVFADSLYMYGPQTRPLTEEMPLTNFGAKPRVRAEITRQWLDAHHSGIVSAVAVRASDFYGPDVPTSVISTYGPTAGAQSGASALSA
jgi:nucleoside-diphosphate-sugar epimerase